MEQQRRIRIAREAFRWKADREGEAGRARWDGRGSSVDLDSARWPPLDDRGAFYLRHGDPEDRGFPRTDECGFWHYDREELPGGGFAVNFSDEGAGSMGPGQFAGSDCVFSTVPTTPKGLQHFAPGMGGLEPWEAPRVQNRTRAEAELGLSTDSYAYEVGAPDTARAATRRPSPTFRQETDLPHSTFPFQLTDIQVARIAAATEGIDPL